MITNKEPVFGGPRILVPMKFGPRQIWTLRNAGPKLWGPNFSVPRSLGTKFLGDQKSQGSEYDRGPFQL